jgi:ribosomal peptide maturation radical SAM protein 1
MLLVVPPFASLTNPSLGVHILQACGRKAGFRVQVLYANILLAQVIGEKNYTRICDAPMGSFAAERFFARSAYGLPPLGRHANRMFEPSWVISADHGVEVEPDFAGGLPIALRELRRLEAQAAGFVDSVAKATSERSYRIVGCSTTFEQTAASVALLNRIKFLDKNTVTILGGANCEGEMARGIASLGASIDYIFSGESEATFVDFVRTILAGSYPKDRIIRGEPCTTMDALPTPMFTEFYEQRKRFLTRSPMAEEETEILYETSRGCWWGQKQHCTFCGLNGEGMAFRHKTADRVIEELRALLDAHPTKKVLMTDNIMPHGYFKTLLPRLATELPEHSIFYEQKANLSLSKVLALKQAGIRWIQPGIEALSSRLLKLMKKGVQGRQNLMLLRDARAAGVQLTWNLLWGFPGDDVEAYQETLAIVPLLHHFQPPDGLWHLSLDRFSPYFSRPAEFGVRNLVPLAAYYDFLPKTADVNRVAYHFMANYGCGSHDQIDVIHNLWREVGRWHAAWKRTGGEPLEDLRIAQDQGLYVLVDTRRVSGTKKTHVLEETEASTLVTSRPYSGSKLETWALQEKVAIVMDGWFVPLPVADPKILLALVEGQNCTAVATSTSLPTVGLTVLD